MVHLEVYMNLSASPLDKGHMIVHLPLGTSDHEMSYHGCVYMVHVATPKDEVVKLLVLIYFLT